MKKSWPVLTLFQRNLRLLLKIITGIVIFPAWLLKGKRNGSQDNSVRKERFKHWMGITCNALYHNKLKTHYIVFYILNIYYYTLTIEKLSVYLFMVIYHIRMLYAQLL